MTVLVWHWGRHGAGPRFAASLAAGFGGLLSLPRTAELLSLPQPPECHLPVSTYDSPASLVRRLATAPLLLRQLNNAIATLRPTLAVCAMPALLDPLMLHALRRHRIPALVIAHDAAAHAGEDHPLRMRVQRHVLRRADHAVALSTHVAGQLGNVPALFHPPFDFGPMPPPRAHGGRLRILSFGRLLPYKGLGLLAATLRHLDPALVEARIAGSGPETPELAALRDLPHARVENRWVPEVELPALLAWADVILLTHRAASQSGLIAAAQGTGRFLVTTDAGGLDEQSGGTAVPPDPEILAAAVMATRLAPPPPVPDHAAEWRRLAEGILALATSPLPSSPAPSSRGPAWLPCAWPGIRHGHTAWLPGTAAGRHRRPNAGSPR